MAEDYMSDAFLLGLDDVRPGLKTMSQKRKDKASERSRTEPKQKRIRASEQEARSKGLATHISTENKGFSMLEKMGYKKGMGLGKNGTGLTAPIPILLREGKGGLGRDVHVKEQAEQRKAKEKLRFDDFRQHKQCVFSMKREDADLRKSQRACEQLDSAKGIDGPQEYYFWPAAFAEEEDEGEEEEEKQEVDVSKQLHTLTEYLRTTHFYCVWCGTAFDDMEDLVQHCPGDTAEAHEE